VGEDDSYEESEESEEEYIGIDDPQRILQDFLLRRQEQEAGFFIDYNVVLADLEANLP